MGDEVQCYECGLEVTLLTGYVRYFQRLPAQELAGYGWEGDGWRLHSYAFIML